MAMSNSSRVATSRTIVSAMARSRGDGLIDFRNRNRSNREFGFELNGSINNWIYYNLCVSKHDASYWWKATSILP